MSIDTILDLTRLPVRARIEPREERNRHQLVLGRLVLVLKQACRSLDAWPAQVVVVAELVVVLAFLDVVEGGLGDVEGWVEAAGAGVPLYSLVIR